jgi:hypothetical protein
VAGFNLTGVKPAELRALYRDLQKQGVGLSMTGRTHVRLEFPNGARIVGPLTSGNRHAAKQMAGRIKRHTGWDPMSDPGARIESTTQGGAA